MEGSAIPDSPKFFTVTNVEGVSELVLGTADFVSRPIIVLAQDVYAPFKLTNLAARLFSIYETTPQAVDAF